MIELDSLKFTVDTSDLVQAVAKVGDLQKAVSALNKPLAENARISAKAAKEAAAIAAAESKAAQATAKAELAQVKLNTAKDRAEKASARVVKSTQSEISVVEKLNLQLEYMAKGFTTGQSGRLASMKAQGLAIEEISKAMDIFNQMTKIKGGDPFDKSLSGTKSLMNALKELRIETKLVDQGIELTSKQYKEFAREKMRIVQAGKIEGASLTEIKNKLREQQVVFIDLAKQVNSYSDAEKLRERATRDRANAIRAVTAEDEKMSSVMRTMNTQLETQTSLSDKNARSIANYERNLRLAGITGEQAASKLLKYKEASVLVANAEQKRKVDFLSRALAPQISDVVVSLAGGMNPMTVLLQQGLQVRDLIGLSGVAADKLKESFKRAASDMVTSLKGTAVALGSLLIGGLTDAGAAVLNFGSKITGTNIILDALRGKLLAAGAAGTVLEKLFMVLARVAAFAAGLAAFVLPVAALIAFAVALKQVIAQENELNRSLTATGYIAGVSYNNVQIFTAALEAQGIAANKSNEVIAEMAKVGGFAASSIDMVVKTSTKLSKVLGVDVADTVKQFSDLAKEPSKALIEWANKTGLVDVATLKMVIALEESGKKSQAAALAMKAYADASQNAADRVSANYGYLTRFGMSVKEVWNDAWNAVMGWGAKKPNAAVLQDLEQKLKDTNPRLSADRAKLNAEIEQLKKDMFKESNKEVEKSANKKAVEAVTKLKGMGVYGDTKKDALQQGIDEIKEFGIVAGHSKDEIDKMIVKYRELHKLPKSAADSEANKLLNAYLKDIERGTDLLEKSEQKTEDLTNAERILNDIRSSSNWSKYSEGWKAGIIALFENAKAVELNNKVYDAFAKDQQAFNEIFNDATKETEELTKAEALLLKIKSDPRWNTYSDNIKAALQEQAKRISLTEKETDAYKEMRKIVKDINEENKKLNQTVLEQTAELDLQLSIIGLIPEEQAKVLKLKKLELQYQKEINKITEIKGDSQEAIDARTTLVQDALKRYQTGIENVNKEVLIKNQTDLIDGISDAVQTGLFQGGNAGGKKLRAIIESELMKPITVFIRAIVGDIVNGTSGSGSSSSGGNALGGIINAGSKLLDLFSNAGSKLGSFSSDIATRLGEYLSTSGNSSIAGFGESMASNAGTIGTIAGAAGQSIAGYGIYKGLSGGYKINKTLDTIGKIASLFGPIYGAIGGLVNRAFGRKLAGSGVNGNFSESGFSGNSFQFYKGGWFRSDKTVNTPLDGNTSSAINTQFTAIKQTVLELGRTLGMADGFLAGFSKSFSISFNGLTEEQIQQELAKALTEAGDGMADMVYGLEQLKNAGESSLAALSRLSTSLTSVNKLVTLLGGNKFSSNLSGADSADQLANLFGGVSSMQSAVTDFFNNFYSAEEQLAAKTADLNSVFAALGLAVPSNIAEYKNLVKAQDLNTDTGRGLYSSLIAISSAFLEVKGAVNEVTSTLVEEVNRLRGIVSTSAINGFEGTKQSFLSAIAMAQGGDPSAIASLPGLSQSLETMFSSNASSLEDVNRFRSWLANSITSVVPGFDSGGLHSGGVRIVGESGPELEVTGPSRIYNANDTMSMFGQSEVVNALLVVNTNLEMLRAEVRADVMHNAKTAKLLDRVIPEGDSIQVSGTVTAI